MAGRDEEQQLEFATRQEWLDWLEQHHTRQDAVWLVFRKKVKGQSTFGYEEALQEALCFGWIDGTVRRLDEQRYRQRFSPRRPRSGWSESNLHRCRTLIDEGRMRPAGLEKLGEALQRFEQEGQPHVEPATAEADPALMALLQAEPQARQAFEQQPPGRRRLQLRWVMDAKKAETRHRRMTQLVQLLAQGRPWSPLTPGK